MVDAGIDKSIFQGSSVDLTGIITGQYNGFLWTPFIGLTNTNTLFPTANPLITTRYFLTANALQSCATITDSVLITVFTKVEPPNAFSPNGDGINDIWVVPGLAAYSNSSLQIFDRNGQIIFQSKPYTNGWNGIFKGTLLPIGTYYYIIDRGAGFDTISGSILLIR